ncbi:MAG: 50S ribosomal protein L2 [Candidatus Woesearchaeota archaeon]|nr:50S ribosomal protein L2 [Candidatus Woesearchaeota archaeon]
MGKNLISQKRGKGSGRYKAPSFRYAGRCCYKKRNQTSCLILDIIHSSGHYAPLINVRYADGTETLLPAPEGVRKGDILFVGGTELKNGNIMLLKDLPAGTEIFNIEMAPGDGGKLVRTAGGVARVLGKLGSKVTIQLPSKREKVLDEKCMATVGIVAGAGKNSKPFLKAGIRHFKMFAKNKRYPRIHGISMNAVQHPFGGSSSHHKGIPTIAPKNAPPGRKVGKIRPSRTGWKRK